MNIIKAVKTGKKIRRPDWGEGDYIYECDGRFFCKGGAQYPMGSMSILADDWEVYEPEKCEACQEADWLVQRGCHSNNSDHLRKYHCTCKGG
jgi:hypothetical protein